MRTDPVSHYKLLLYLICVQASSPNKGVKFFFCFLLCGTYFYGMSLSIRYTSVANICQISSLKVQGYKCTSRLLCNSAPSYRVYIYLLMQ